ncbi:malonyl-CoA decarboxylase domain-containing protein [Sphingopyxis sp. H050]|jgi:malonyl-CoA decarboxylase|uniref:malonyl-CoA decarboxylase domain-containing protein n=1 Tax=Sphingopyxis sp. H050 TaxID=1759072 RepID=UPI0012E38CAD|nr:malonyl-CoA decarboxylase family protein [Sphingopyxis sp. H050]
MPSADGLVALAQELLSPRRTVSGPGLAAELLSLYALSGRSTRHAFLRMLASRFPLDGDRVETAFGLWREKADAASLAALHAATEARPRQLLQLLNLAPDGTRQLVGMRSDLLELEDFASVRELDADFAHVFTSWFNAGFLELRAIDWHSPAAILDLIIAYEAVHAIDGWDELRRRLAPADRRCYAFFHPRLADEPLIFIEVALTQGLPISLDELISPSRSLLDPARVNTAIFYSISNCQRGLRGIPFGNFLIKRVVERLHAELPQISTFATMSPVPGFGAWAEKNAAGATGEALRAHAARYLLEEKSRSGEVADPVGRFHLGNGARLEAVHFCEGEPSSLASSANIMVNYVYELSKLEQNHLALLGRGEVASSSAVRALAGVNDRRSEASML